MAERKVFQVHALHAERDAHQKTAKQLADMMAVLGCIEKRVERFATIELPGLEDLLNDNTAPLGTFVEDLERMLGVDK